MSSIVLTDDEVILILNRRKKLEEEKNKLFLDRHVVKTTADYLDWLWKNGQCSTFSTFVNDFGYESNDFKAESIFRYVEAIRKSIVNTLSVGIA